MAQERFSGTAAPLVYPQVRGPGIVVWVIAGLVGLIGVAFVGFSIMAIPSAAQGKFDGPPTVLGVFFLIGLGTLAAAEAMVLYRERIVIDPRTRTVTRHRSWGPIRRALVLSGEVTSVRLMHDTRRTAGGKGSNYNSGGAYTVCAMKLVTRQGEFWHLSERPEAGEAMRDLLPSVLGRIAPDYEQIQRNEAMKLCAATGWRLDDRLERSATGFVPTASALRGQKVEETARLIGATGFVPAASAPCAQRVEDIAPFIDRINAPAWLQRVTPRRVRRRGLTVLVSLLGWGAVVGPLVAMAVWVGACFWDLQSMRTIDGQVIGLADDGRGRKAVDYRFTVDGHEYTTWTRNVPAELWAVAKQRASMQVSYLPRDPHHSNLGLPSPRELWPEDWINRNIKLIPSVLLAIAITIGMRRRAKRIARAKLLAERGRMSLGMIFRRAQKAGQSRTPARLAIDGFPVSFLFRPAAENDPNQVRYEFMADRRKRFGYVPADLLGIFRSDGLVGVVYDPHDPEVHMPLAVIERYLTFE